MKNLLSTFAEALLNANEIGIPEIRTEGSVMANILSTVYYWAGAVAIGMIIYGGFMYVLSNGDASKVKKAKDTLLYSIVGLIVVILAFAITTIVIGGVKGA